MDLHYSDSDLAFRVEIRDWLAQQLDGEWGALRGLGGPGRDHEAIDERLAWNRHLAAHGWTCVGWPKEHGGRGLSLWEQVIFHEEYARSNAPARVNHLGEELLGPTLIAFGTPEQQQRFLPSIIAVDELWAQGYSEPGAGSDLANVQTKARLTEGGEGGPRVPSGSSTARRCGRPTPTSPSGSSSSRVPSPAPSATRVSRSFSCRWTSPAWRSVRSSS